MIGYRNAARAMRNCFRFVSECFTSDVATACVRRLVDNHMLMRICRVDVRDETGAAPAAP